MANANPAYYLSRVPGGSAYSPVDCREIPLFNGASQYVTFPARTITSSYSLKAKVEMTAIGAIGYIVDSATGNNYLRVQSDGLIRFRVTDNLTNSYTKSSLSALTAGVVYDIRAEVTPTQIELFINDVSQGATVLTNPQDAAVTYLSIASTTAGSSVLNGSVWDVTVVDAVFPLDDGFDNNPAARNTGVGGDGTFINMTQASWIKRCDL